jgi:hypothetical protein
MNHTAKMAICITAFAGIIALAAWHAPTPTSTPDAVTATPDAPTPDDTPKPSATTPPASDTPETPPQDQSATPTTEQRASPQQAPAATGFPVSESEFVSAYVRANIGQGEYSADQLSQLAHDTYHMASGIDRKMLRTEVDSLDPRAQRAMTLLGAESLTQTAQ